MAETAIIVGGGISGLATAYYLGKQGIRSVIIEKSTRLGGLIRTDRIEGCELEAGPDSYLAAKTSVTELAEDLGSLKDGIVGSNDRARRVFIVRGGRLVPMPEGMVMMAPGEWGPLLRSELFSAEAKRRFLSERHFKPLNRSEDISVGQLVEEHFGPEAVEYLAEPLLCGVYGGDSARLSAESVLPRFMAYERNYGSLIKGVRKQRQKRIANGALFRTFRGGMQSLTDALAAATPCASKVIGEEVRAVEQVREGWLVKTRDGSFQTPHLVLACPAYISANLLEHTAPETAAVLAGIPYSSAILAMLVYQRTELEHPLDGFGFLVPVSERHGVAAATWVNTKWPDRIPPHLAALRAFIVGSDADRLLTAPDPDILTLVRSEFRRLMGITAQPLFSTLYRWPHAMPQYIVGHSERLRRLNDALTDTPNLRMVGNAYDGVGIPDCIRLAKQAANEIVDQLPRD